MGLEGGSGGLELVSEGQRSWVGREIGGGTERKSRGRCWAQ